MIGDASCPSCGASGSHGTPCSERVCSRRGYYFIDGDLAQAPVSDPMVGRAINDYVLLKPLGSGGFGTVYLAQQQPIGLETALKLLDSSGEPGELDAMLDRFQGEAKALASLAHPNIVRLLKFGVHQGLPYLVMELVRGGETLAAYAQARHEAGDGFASDELDTIFAQVCHGLEAAHKSQIIHRDIKPENIMIQPVAGNPLLVRILDFGLAKFVESTSQSSAASGTPLYMAPEQLSGQHLGPWTDVYAVAVMAYRLLFRSEPFPGSTHQAILARKLDPSWDPVAPLVPLEFPEVVYRVFRTALARVPSERYQSVAALRTNLSAAFGAMSGEADATRSSTLTPAECTDETTLGREEVTPAEAASPALDRARARGAALWSSHAARVAAVALVAVLASIVFAWSRADAPIRLPAVAQSVSPVPAVGDPPAPPPHSAIAPTVGDPPAPPPQSAIAPTVGDPPAPPPQSAIAPTVGDPPAPPPQSAIAPTVDCAAPAAADERARAGVRWVAIQGGLFRYGSLEPGTGDRERDAYQVAEVADFEIARTETTVAQYALWARRPQCSDLPAGQPTPQERSGGPDHPVARVTWHQAHGFCKWMGGRLPTEIEWEYAARSGGRAIPFPWGKAPPSCERAIVPRRGSRHAGCDTGGTWPVCSRPDGNTRDGLCDMAGNVSEWVADCFFAGESSIARRPKPRGPELTCDRTFRGSSFEDRSVDVNTIWRQSAGAHWPDTTRGFRCARDPSGSESGEGR